MKVHGTRNGRDEHDVTAEASELVLTMRRITMRSVLTGKRKH